MTSNEATNQINQALREDFPAGYDFAGLRDRFLAGYREAVEFGDEYVTIKVPSHSEFDWPTDRVKVALGLA